LEPRVSTSSNGEENLWVLWGRIVSNWDTEWKRRNQFVRDLVRQGVPHHFRGIVWQLLAGVDTSPEKNMYATYIKVRCCAEARPALIRQQSQSQKYFIQFRYGYILLYISGYNLLSKDYREGNNDGGTAASLLPSLLRPLLRTIHIISHSTTHSCTIHYLYNSFARCES
jgi:hypothetical protein